MRTTDTRPQMSQQIEATKKIWHIFTNLGRYVFALFMEQGTGKTRVVIDLASDLWARGEITGLLVVAAPNGVHINWDEIELPTWCTAEFYSAAWEAPSSQSKAKQKELEECLVKDDTLKILCVNIEAMSHKSAVDFVEKFVKAHTVLAVIDESSWIKNWVARTKNLINTIRPHTKYRGIMTGTPWTQSPLDIYHQFEWLDEEILGMRDFNCFRARYAIMYKITHPLMIAAIAKNMGISKEKCMMLARANRIPRNRIPPMIEGYKRLDELKAKVDPYSYRVLKEECTDLPPKIYQRHFVELGKEQKKMYNDLKEKLRIEFADSEISATHALTKLLRLQQIIGGFVGLDDLEDDKRQVVAIPDNKRIDSLVDLLNTLPENEHVIIWARFRAEIEAIREAVHKRTGRVSACYYGDTKRSERIEIVNDFQDNQSPLNTFIGNPHAAGYGLTLTAATTVIYYSNDFSLEVRLQSEDRAHRIGQTNHVTYIDMLARGTIDEKIIEALRSKKNLADTMTGDRTTWI